MTKARIEGLLAAFPKLMTAGKQHTYVETDSVRYVYQPMEKLHAEKLLNQLYGKSWQTPDVIRTLKRSSGSGGKTAPLKPRNTPATAATTAKKKKPRPPPVRPDESVLGDFSICKNLDWFL